MILHSPTSQSLTLNLVLEKTENGLSVASVLELPNCRVEAPTDEQAIAQLRQLVTTRFIKAQILPLEIPLSSPVETQPVRENPWTEFIGMFEGDAEFAALAAELQSEREPGE